MQGQTRSTRFVGSFYVQSHRSSSRCPYTLRCPNHLVLLGQRPTDPWEGPVFLPSQHLVGPIHSRLPGPIARSPAPIPDSLGPMQSRPAAHPSHEVHSALELSFPFYSFSNVYRYAPNPGRVPEQSAGEAVWVHHPESS